MVSAVAEAGATSTFTGLVSIELASLLISSGTVAENVCTSLAACVAHSDCGTGGSCMGALLGTCDCTACMSYMPCNSHSECGGLNHSCNSLTKSCDCYGVSNLENNRFMRTR